MIAGGQIADKASACAIDSECGCPGCIEQVVDRRRLAEWIRRIPRQLNHRLRLEFLIARESAQESPDTILLTRFAIDRRSELGPGKEGPAAGSARKRVVAARRRRPSPNSEWRLHHPGFADATSPDVPTLWVFVVIPDNYVIRAIKGDDRVTDAVIRGRDLDHR